MNRTILEIKNLGDVRTYGAKLDEHQKIDSYIKNGDDFKQVKDHQFVWNISKGRISNSVTKNFQLIQHRDIFSTVHDALSNLNLQVKGRLDDFEDMVRADLVFQNQDLVNDGEKGIQLGIRVINSNNKRSSFRLEMYAFRLICQNGMSIGSMIPGVRDIQIHYGLEKIEFAKVQVMVEKFVKKVINHSNSLQKLVNLSMKDSVEWNIVETIMKKAIHSQKFMKEIAKRLEVDVVEVIDKKNPKKVNLQFIPKKNQKISRWDLYNAITNLISHDEQLKPTAQNSLEESSRKILKNNFGKLQELYVITP